MSPKHFGNKPSRTGCAAPHAVRSRLFYYREEPLMKKIATTLVLLVACASTAFASNAVRISQMYAGGGNTGATYSNDYIELFNNSGTAVDISGWSLQYGSATGTVDLGTCVNCETIFPAGSSIPACGYFLVQLAAGTTVTNAPLPVAADLVIPQATANNMGASAGKIALRSSSVTAPCASASVDLIGWGTTANCFESAAAGATSNSSMAVRNGGGTIDSDNNFSDFTIVANAVPRNSHSPGNGECLVTPTRAASWGAMKSLYR